MEKLKEIAEIAMKKENMMVLVGAGVAGLTVVYLGGWPLYKKYKKQRSRRSSEYTKDTVILYQDPRGPCGPSVSPFALKLETYLRLAKIPYEVNHDLIFGSKGKFPWIEYNGKEIADSQFCIEFLNKERGVDLDRKLTLYQKAQARAFRKLLEEELFWFVLLDRWVYAEDQSLMRLVFPWFILILIGKKAKASAYHQGLGRHTKDEQNMIMEQDFKALADFIGNNKFLMGDEPSETDCVMFAMLVQIKVHAPGTFGSRTLIERFPSLVAYIDRMKALVWPDWEECTTKKGTVKATK